MVTAYGILGDHPPADHEGFLGFIKSVAAPDIYDALQDAEPLHTPVAYRFPVSLRRRYERLPRFPRGLLVMGDAVCSLNPSYAQGMTVAALETRTLRRHLRSGRAPQPLAFQRDIARDAVDRVWNLMTGSDRAYPGVEGERHLMDRAGHSYVTLVQRAGTRDPHVAAAFLRVIALLEPEESLLRPTILLRVLKHSLGTAPAYLRALIPGTAERGARTP